MLQKFESKDLIFRGQCVEEGGLEKLMKNKLIEEELRCGDFVLVHTVAMGA